MGKGAEAQGPTAGRGAVDAGTHGAQGPHAFPCGGAEGCKLSTVISEWGSGLEGQVFWEGSREGALGWSGGEGKVRP